MCRTRFEIAESLKQDRLIEKAEARAEAAEARAAAAEERLKDEKYKDPFRLKREPRVRAFG